MLHLLHIFLIKIVYKMKYYKSILYLLIITVGAVFINACNKEDIEDPIVLEVGTDYQGGIIVYILNSIDEGYDVNEPHGLIVSASDIGNPVKWMNDAYTTTNATEESYGAGESNTQLIVENQGIGSYAAKVCFDLVIDGYDDWYLPSQVELNIIYVNRDSLGVFSNDLYWCSTEYGLEHAQAQNLWGGTQQPRNKDTFFPIRAVRNF